MGHYPHPRRGTGLHIGEVSLAVFAVVPIIRRRRRDGWRWWLLDINHRLVVESHHGRMIVGRAVGVEWIRVMPPRRGNNRCAPKYTGTRAAIIRRWLHPMRIRLVWRICSLRWRMTRRRAANGWRWTTRAASCRRRSGGGGRGSALSSSLSLSTSTRGRRCTSIYRRRDQQQRDRSGNSNNSNGRKPRHWWRNQLTHDQFHFSNCRLAQHPR